MSIIQALSLIFEDIFESLDLPRDLGAVRVSERAETAQFQCNGAMPAAKKLGKNPREIAQMVIDKASGNPAFRELTIGGPGFINIFVTDDFLQTFTTDLSLPTLSHGDTVILDYGGPNIAKPMHVGHLRTGIIGDCLRAPIEISRL